MQRSTLIVEPHGSHLRLTTNGDISSAVYIDRRRIDTAILVLVYGACLSILGTVVIGLVLR